MKQSTSYDIKVSLCLKHHEAGIQPEHAINLIARKNSTFFKFWSSVSKKIVYREALTQRIEACPIGAKNGC